MDRRKTSDILWHVFQFAKQDRLSLLNAYPRGSQEAKQIKADMKAIVRLQERIFGTSRTKFDQLVDNASSVNILDATQLNEILEELL